MMAKKYWAACKCFYKRNFYIKQIDQHLEYLGEEQFMFQYQNLFTNCDGRKILEEVQTEAARRRERFAKSEEHREAIQRQFTPNISQQQLHGIKDFSTAERTEILDDVFSFPVFDHSFCDDLVKEIGRFKSCGLEHSQVNSMNRHGVLLPELGLQPLVAELMAGAELLARQLYPDLGQLDSYKAFTIEYDAETRGHQTELGTHFDNAEVTLNISLTAEHEGGELYFVRDGRLAPVEHRKGVGVLHRGAELHGAMPLAAGTRTNLIVWFRSSEVRNLVCPMCGDTPDLEPVAVGEATGDGFTLADTETDR